MSVVAFGAKFRHFKATTLLPALIFLRFSTSLGVAIV